VILLDLHAYPRAQENVIGRSIEKEAVLVLPQRGEIKVVNEVGALIWQLCDGQHSVAQIAETVCQQYDVTPEQAERDTCAFLDALAQRAMIRF
jgi:glycerol-3-phosphate O-acyltransferase